MAAFIVSTFKSFHPLAGACGQQIRGAAVTGYYKLGGKLDQGIQNKGAFVEPRVRQGKLRRPERPLII